MIDLPNGQYFRAYLASNDISTATALPLFDEDGNAITLAQGERPVFEDIVLNNGGTASVITVFQDNDGDSALDSGEELYAASLAANSQNSGNFVGAIKGFKKGNTAAKGKVFVVASAASANTKIVATGRILKV